MPDGKASLTVEVDTSQAEEALGRIEDALDRIIEKFAAIKSLKEGPKKNA